MNNQENKHLPAILIGGAPDAGKSVLTYNLTQKLRSMEIPHYVLRANPDGEGDWFLDGGWFLEGNDLEAIRELKKRAHRKWSDRFRQLVAKAIQCRQLPLIVDIGGLPREEDTGILLACTHSILLLKDGEEQANETWRSFTKRTSLTPLAELRSSLRKEEAELTAREPVVTGTITGLERPKRFKPLHDEVLEVLFERIKKLFLTLSDTEREKLHLGTAPTESFPVHLLRYLRRLAPGQKDWFPDLIDPLLSELSAQQAPLALYERAPNWLYGLLALHGDLHQPLYQFDPRFGWVTAPELHASPSVQTPQEIIDLEVNDKRKGVWMLTVLLKDGYVDYETDAEDLIFPDPPSNCGVIINGKLPLWLFTSLARFYARRNVPWIALNYARETQAYIIYSQVEEYVLGDTVSLPI